VTITAASQRPWSTVRRADAVRTIVPSLVRDPASVGMKSLVKALADEIAHRTEVRAGNKGALVADRIRHEPRGFHFRSVALRFFETGMGTSPARTQR
jgi:hypothetical protein